MSCLTVKVHKIGDELRGHALKVGDELRGHALKVGDELRGHALKVGDELRGHTLKVGDELRGHASLVCTETGAPRLRVSPEVMWLTPGNGFEGVFTVVSNVDWKIE